jgi:hypothetical protein
MDTGELGGRSSGVRMGWEGKREGNVETELLEGCERNGSVWNGKGMGVDRSGSGIQKGFVYSLRNVDRLRNTNELYLVRWARCAGHAEWLPTRLGITHRSLGALGGPKARKQFSAAGVVCPLDL